MILDYTLVGSVDWDRGPCDSDHRQSQFTRLETRTKESNMYASIWVVKTLMRIERESVAVQPST